METNNDNKKDKQDIKPEADPDFDFDFEQIYEDLTFQSSKKTDIIPNPAKEGSIIKIDTVGTFNTSLDKASNQEQPNQLTDEGADESEEPLKASYSEVDRLTTLGFMAQAAALRSQLAAEEETKSTTSSKAIKSSTIEAPLAALDINSKERLRKTNEQTSDISNKIKPNIVQPLQLQSPKIAVSDNNSTTIKPKMIENKIKPMMVTASQQSKKPISSFPFTIKKNGPQQTEYQKQDKPQQAFINKQKPKITFENRNQLKPKVKENLNSSENLNLKIKSPVKKMAIEPKNKLKPKTQNNRNMIDFTKVNFGPKNDAQILKSKKENDSDDESLSVRSVFSLDSMNEVVDDDRKWVASVNKNDKGTDSKKMVNLSAVANISIKKDQMNIKNSVVGSVFSNEENDTDTSPPKNHNTSFQSQLKNSWKLSQKSKPKK